MNWSYVFNTLSVLATALAVYAAFRQNDHQNRIYQLETARDAERRWRASRARLRAYFASTVPMHTIFRIVNDGEAAARRISVTVDGRPIAEAGEMPLAHDVDLGLLGPGGYLDFDFVRAMGEPTTVRIAIRWFDDSGDPGSWESTLTL